MFINLHLVISQSNGKNIRSQKWRIIFGQNLENTAIVFWLDIYLYLKKFTLGCVVWGDTIIVMVVLIFLMYRLVHLFIPFRAPGIEDPRVPRVPRVSRGIPNFWLIFLFIHGMQSQWQSLNFFFYFWLVCIHDFVPSFILRVGL